MKKNGISNGQSSTNNSNNLGAILNMLMNNKNTDKTKNNDNDKTKNINKTKADFPVAPSGYRYAKLIEKHDALSKKIDLKNKIDKNNG